MSGETHTAGTKVYIGDNASPTQWTHIKGVLGLPPIVQEAPEIDVTSLDSVGGREYIGALSAGDELDLEFNWHKDDAGQIALAAAKETKAATPFRFDFPDGTRMEASAVVRSFGPGAAVDEQLKGQTKLKISGAVESSEFTP